MTFLPSLTSTKKERIGEFLEALGQTGVRTIAFFPTALKADERAQLYTDMERIAGLTTPHVHLRSDMGDAEIEYLTVRFGAEVFNVHPAASNTAYVPESRRW